MKTIAGLLVVVGLLLVAGLFWTAGELHYGNCVEAAQAANPAPPQTDIEARLEGSPDVAAAHQRQKRSVARCTRTPW